MADLLALSRAEQERAKRLLGRRLYLHLGTLILGLLALFLQSPWVYAAAVLALVSEVVALWLRTAGQGAHQVAETARRRALIARELGEDPSRINTAALSTDFSKWASDHAAEWADPNYYATSGPVGSARLCSALGEASFWSAQLYLAAAKSRCVRFIVVVLVLIISMLFVEIVEAGTAGTLAARAVTIVLGSLIAVDELSVFMGFFAAARVSDRTTLLLENADPANLAQVLSIFSDYAVATATAAPIPTSIYMKRRDQLDAAWAARGDGS